MHKNEVLKHLCLLNINVIVPFYLIIYRMHHQCRHLNMPIKSLILNTGTLNDGSNFRMKDFILF